MRDTPLTCILDTIPVEDRADHLAGSARLLGALPTAYPPEGEGLEFELSADRLAGVTGFIERERRCCPFLSFRLQLPSWSASLRLSITGPAGTRALLSTTFSPVSE
jgi:hypothetical protein